MKTIRNLAIALLLAFGVAGVVYAQDTGYDEPPAQSQAAPQNPVQQKYADGKVVVVVTNARHYGYRLGDVIPMEIVIISDPGVTINVDGISHGILSQSGSDFELVAPASVRKETSEGKNVTIVDLLLRSWVTVDQSSGNPKNNIAFNADFLFATQMLPDGKNPQWVPATTPDFIVTTSNTATDSSKDLLMGDVDQKATPNPTMVKPLRIAGGLLLLIPLGWLCFLVYRRLNPPRELPANEKAWMVFDRILSASQEDGHVTYQRTEQIAHALRVYLGVEFIASDEVKDSLETFFAYDESKRYELTRVAQEALAILDRALYERPADATRTPALSAADTRELFARIERVVPRP